MKQEIKKAVENLRPERIAVPAENPARKTEQEENIHESAYDMEEIRSENEAEAYAFQSEEGGELSELESYIIIGDALANPRFKNSFFRKR